MTDTLAAVITLALYPFFWAYQKTLVIKFKVQYSLWLMYGGHSEN